VRPLKVQQSATVTVKMDISYQQTFRDIHIIDIPKIPENLRKCPYCSSNEIESEIHFENVFHAPLQLTNDMKLKYAGFDSSQGKTLQYVHNERSIKE